MSGLAAWLVATFFCQPAFAYLDPGTGSMLTSTVVALLGTLLFFFKGIYYKALRGVPRLIGRKVADDTSTHSLVFYSEGRQYWSTFKPVIAELVGRGVQCRYLTSDERDPGLSYSSDVVSSEYIGAGTQAYAYLRRLEADVCVMTTPGLDVLQIKRSRGVKHYAHLVHAPTDAAIYRKYSFDYYDSILTSGEHQINSIKKLEELRGTRRKLILKTGCVYYDELSRRSKEVEHAAGPKTHGTVLVAPTWGTNGLLRRFGKGILVPLLDRGHKVILRPHPQSFISEGEMLNDLRKDLGQYGNLRWDSDSDGMGSMALADVMVSDISGVAFDFAFLFEKPVITVKYDLNRIGLEAADLPWDPWELTVLDVIGKQIDEAELVNLPDIIEFQNGTNGRKEAIRSLRERSVYNFGCSSAHVANELLLIRDSVRSSQSLAPGS